MQKMTLKEWIKDSGKTAYRVTIDLKVEHSTMWRWLSGRSCPQPEMQRRIMTYTNGAVTPNDWVLGGVQ